MPARSVLITGCSSGIGHATAWLLRERGWQVIASARQEKDVAALHGEGFEAVRLDLADPASVADGLEAALARTGGRLDALFNNGAFGLPGAVEDLSREALRAQLETNLVGTHDLTQRVVALMRRQGAGRIVQNSSVLGFVALPYRGAYICSKYALEGLTDTLRLELRGSGVEVVLVEPGPIATPFAANARRAFRDWIDAEASAHAEIYERVERRLAGEGPPTPFTLPAEAVARVVARALEARRPRARYYVTVPTYLFAWLRRLLPTRALDWVALKVSERERR